MNTLRRTNSSRELFIPRQQHPLRPEYEVGNFLRLKLSPNSASSKKPCIVTAEILKCFTPFTLSQVMLVRMHHPDQNLEGDFVLKLYDRRYMAHGREESDRPPWSANLERQYRKFIFSNDFDDVSATIRSWRVDGDEEDEGEEQDDSEEEMEDYGNWDEPRNETHLQYLCNWMYEAELEVYNRCYELQGTDIPRLIARVEMSDYYISKGTLPDDRPPQSAPSFDCVPGLLLQHIPNAFTLMDLYEAEPPPPAPMETWQYICDEAISIVNAIMGHDILNADVKNFNVLVHWNRLQAKYKVTMIDFGNCRFRGKNQSDFDWREQQAHEDEEGAIGFVMERHLCIKRGGGFKYTPTEYAQALSDDFMGEDGPRIEPVAIAKVSSETLRDCAQEFSSEFMDENTPRVESVAFARVSCV